jgi:CO/xanthine dehydrogenase FAD-binding subunit
MRQVFLPNSLPECWDILEQEPQALVYAGGTDLLVQWRGGDIDARTLVCLERIGDLQGVREEGAHLWLGAGSTHADLLGDPLVQRHLPVLAKALKTLGSPLIRNMGTIGGNVCTASPAGDTLPPLYILDAELELQSRAGRREMPIGDFITGPGTTDLRRGEILTGVLVRKPEGCHIHHYEKIGQRRALACAIASMAAMIQISETGVMTAVRLAWGSVAPTVVASPDVEALLIGQPLSRITLERAAILVRKTVSPIDDVRASASYRREVAGNLLLRLC